MQEIACVLLKPVRIWYIIRAVTFFRVGCVEECVMGKKKGKIERSIHYFDITLQRIGMGDEDAFVSYKNQPEKTLLVFRYFQELNIRLKKSKNNEERQEILEKMEYMTETGDKLYVEVDEINEEKGNVAFRLVLCRPDAFPYIEKEGKLENIVGLVSGEFNLAEVTHCMMFYNEGIMGAEFNFNGARPSAISAYATFKCSKIDRLICTPKLRNDTFKRIANDRGYSLFQLKVKNTPEMRLFLRDKMGFIGSMISRIDELDTYEIVLRRKIGKKKLGFPAVMSKDEMQEFVNKNIENIEKFEVNQGVYKEPVNLLKDKMVTRKEFVMTKNKTIDSDSMYDAIRSFYESSIKEA